MGSPDYNTGGFNDSGDGIFGDPGTDPGSINDYNSWDWKQIMAAINGMAAGTGSDSNEERAKGISDPQSLMDAAAIRRRHPGGTAAPHGRGCPGQLSSTESCWWVW
ncbi:hypothetical protein ACWDAZ_27830 [Streptomyces sp. NPDC001215]